MTLCLTNITENTEPINTPPDNVMALHTLLPKTHFSLLVNCSFLIYTSAQCICQVLFDNKKKSVVNVISTKAHFEKKTFMLHAKLDLFIGTKGDNSLEGNFHVVW